MQLKAKRYLPVAILGGVVFLAAFGIALAAVFQATKVVPSDLSVSPVVVDNAKLGVFSDQAATIPVTELHYQGANFQPPLSSATRVRRQDVFIKNLSTTDPFTLVEPCRSVRATTGATGSVPVNIGFISASLFLLDGSFAGSTCGDERLVGTAQVAPQQTVRARIHLSIEAGLATDVVYTFPTVFGAVGEGAGLGRIAFISNRDGNYEIYVMNADGSNQTRLTNNPTPDLEPAWSPDGNKIAFFSNRDGTASIYVMNADGSNQTNLTSNLARAWGHTWSPDGGKIAFYSQLGPVTTLHGDIEIYVMNADGSNQTRLTNNHPSAWPAWSPDGRKIAFVRDGEIYTMKDDGSNQTKLTNDRLNNMLPLWSPYGDKIAFRSQIGGTWELNVMNADGSNQTRLTNNSAVDTHSAWSPDGSRIAFRSDRDGNPEIYLMNADGSKQTNLTNNPAGDSAPNWGRGP